MNGAKYQGDLKENKIHGTGVYYWSNGNRCEGEFKDNKIDLETFLNFFANNKFSFKVKIWNFLDISLNKINKFHLL